MFQPKDRVTVPNADGRGRLPATVVMVLSENYTDTARAPYAVMVAVDGARPGSTEAHPLADVQPIEDDIIEDCAEESYPTLREQAYDL